LMVNNKGNSMRDLALVTLGWISLLGSAVAAPAKGPEFAVSYPASQAAGPIDGRVILLLSRDMTREPRTHVEANEPLASPYLFGLNVDGLAPGAAAVLNDKAFGWPAARLSAIPSGDYYVQAVLNRYESFHLADGRTLKLAPDRGEGQQWARKPGNLYSTPIKLHVDASHPVRTALLLDQQIGPIQPKTDTELSNTSASAANCYRASGAATSSLARTYLCRKASMLIPMRTIHSWCFTATIPMIFPAFAPHRPMRI
jgi:hypothetical protein